ncbi:MAG TPA: helix-turn-helix transcriptional regulator [Pseudosphingobacterium sp.]|nr:helix-turn-helix transcriptional regulator [Pseudosphingobacterium sp.]
MAVHIGEIIHDLIKEKGLKAKYVADYISVSESTLYDIYRRSSIDVDKLIKFSQLFNKNLFLYYLEEEPIKSMFGKQVQILQTRILELETELDSKNEKIKDQLEMINTQKKVIALQEAKSQDVEEVSKRKR